MRDAGGEFHIIKNTLGEVALEAGRSVIATEASGRQYCDRIRISECARDGKGDQRISPGPRNLSRSKAAIWKSARSAQPRVIVLADLPPLPVLRAQLLGTIMAPASKLVRTLAEPARQLAAVIKAYADKDAAPICSLTLSDRRSIQSEINLFRGTQGVRRWLIYKNLSMS